MTRQRGSDFDCLTPRGSRRLARAVVALACLLCAGLVTAAEAASAANVALSGLWAPLQYHAALMSAGITAPLSVQGHALYEEHQRQLRADPASDSMHTRCLPPGTPRAMLAPYPFEILQSADQVDFIYEVNRAFRIVMLQRPHADPAVWDASYMGESVAHWEGLTLVIDTRNFNSMSWLDDSGLPHSDQLHLIERLRTRAGGSELEDQITVEDAPIYTRPWSFRLLFRRHSEIRLQTDWVCGQPHRSVAGIRNAVSYR